MNQQVTLMHADGRDSPSRRHSPGFPLDLLQQSAGRLRILALLYAVLCFMAGIVPGLVLPEERARFLASFLFWGPGVIGIAVALVVAAVIRTERFSLPTAMNVGLVFEIASSYAIAAAESGDPPGLPGALLGRRLGPALHGGGAHSTAPGCLGRPRVSELGSGHHRSPDRDRRHFSPGEPGAVLLRARVPLPARSEHGLRRCPCGLSAGHRGQARAGAGELPAGGETG